MHSWRLLVIYLFFSPEESEVIGAPISLNEFEEVLKKFIKEKSVGLDGCIFELFQYFYDVMCSFYDVMCKDILDMVELSRLEGYVSVALNSTFITHIPRHVYILWILKMI